MVERASNGVLDDQKVFADSISKQDILAGPVTKKFPPSFENQEIAKGITFQGISIFLNHCT